MFCLNLRICGRRRRFERAASALQGAPFRLQRRERAPRLFGFQTLGVERRVSPHKRRNIRPRRRRFVHQTLANRVWSGAAAIGRQYLRRRLARVRDLGVQLADNGMVRAEARVHLVALGGQRGLPVRAHRLDKELDLRVGLRKLGLQLTQKNFPIVTENHLVQWELARHDVGICIVMDEVGDRDPRMERVLPDLVLPIPVWLTAHRELRGRAAGRRAARQTLATTGKVIARAARPSGICM